MLGGGMVVSYEEGGAIALGDYRRLRDAVGWSKPPVEDRVLRAALDCTWNVVARAADGTVVGLGRLLDDGALYATIWDMIVLPGRQRQGIGREILTRLLRRACGRTIVALVATAQGRSLYESFGFAPESGGSVGMLLRPPAEGEGDPAVSGTGLPAPPGSPRRRGPPAPGWPGR
jgi:GNAT superfamily N-acetyltransferase